MQGKVAAAVLALIVAPSEANRLRSHSRLSALWPEIPNATSLSTMNSTKADVSLNSTVNLMAGMCTEMKNFKNTQYTVTVQIGTPPQEFSVIPDTGSAEVLLASTRCPGCPKNKLAFDRTKSSSYKEDGKVVSIRFGQGDVKSVMGYDKVGFGAAVAESQSMLEMTEQSIRGFADGAFDGVFGLSKLDKVRDDSADTSFPATAKVTTFSVCLGRDSGTAGIINWNMAKDLTFQEVPVVGAVHWSMKMNGVSAESKGVAACAEGCSAIVDTGTSLIAGPADHLEKLGDQIGEIKEDCSNIASLPNILFSVDGKSFPLPPSAYILKMPIEDVGNELAQKFKTKYPNADPKAPVCLPAFMPLSLKSSEGPVWILGMPFLRHYYTKFDRANKKIALAEAPQGACNSCAAFGKHMAGGTAVTSTLDDKGQKQEAIHESPVLVSPKDFLTPSWAVNAPDGFLKL